MSFLKGGDVRAMEKVKGVLVTGGEKLIAWDRDVEVAVNNKVNGVRCMKYNFLCESLYVGCGNSDVIVRDM